MRALVFAIAMLASGMAGAAPLETKFAGTTPIAISGLSDQGTCFPAKISGKVAKRVFDNSGVKLTAVVIEERSGERSDINIDAEKIGAASAVDASNAFRGLQIILREGNRVSGQVFACGAAGRVLMLDTIRAAR